MVTSKRVPQKRRYLLRDGKVIGGDRMRLFRGLLPTQSRQEYELLAEKLKQQEEAPIPRVDLTSTRLMVAVRTRDIEHLLSMLDDSAQAPLDTHLVIEGAMACLRRDVFLMSFERFRRYLAATRITRTMVCILYKPRPGDVPLISRSLVRDGILQSTGTADIGAIGSGDSECDSDEEEEIHAGSASVAPAPRRVQKQHCLPLLP